VKLLAGLLALFFTYVALDLLASDPFTKLDLLLVIGDSVAACWSWMKLLRSQA
jgi:hypothetical protein